MKIKFKKKTFNISAKEVSFLSTGLIFKTRNTENLWFRKIPKKHFSLTSFFVFFPFLILWLDKKNRVVDFHFAKPFETTINSKKKFSSIIELPFNEKNREIILFVVGKERFKYTRELKI